MKILLHITGLFIFAVSTFGQGTVHFGNTATTLITTNDLQGHSGPISIAGSYRFELYVGPFGSPASSLSLVASVANGLGAGRFDAGNVAVPSPGGTQLSFQVRGASPFSGPATYFGESTEGFFTVPSSGSIELFGTGPGQVGGFELTPVPEPATWAVALVGTAVFVFRRRFFDSTRVS